MASSLGGHLKGTASFVLRFKCTLTHFLAHWANVEGSFEVFFFFSFKHGATSESNVIELQFQLRLKI